MFDHEHKKVRIMQKAPFIIDKFGSAELKKTYSIRYHDYVQCEL